MNLTDDLTKIFYSGTHAFTGDKSVVQEIAFLVENEYLGFEKITIGTARNYRSIRNDSKLLERRAEADGGGMAHIALKILGEQYLKKERGLVGQFEHPFCGYFPDVISTDHTVVVECGQTGNPEKLYTYFLQGNINEFIQLPYPGEEDNIIFGYSFTEHEYLKDFLRDLEQTKRNELKNLRDSLKRT